MAPEYVTGIDDAPLSTNPPCFKLLIRLTGVLLPTGPTALNVRVPMVVGPEKEIPLKFPNQIDNKPADCKSFTSNPESRDSIGDPEARLNVKVP